MHLFISVALLFIISIPASEGFEVLYNPDKLLLEKSPSYPCVTDEKHPDNNLCKTYHDCLKLPNQPCKHVALLALFKDKKFYAKGFGVVVGPDGQAKHVLTTMSSSIPKYHNGEHWLAIHRGHNGIEYYGYQLSGSKRPPKVKMSPFDLDTWQDLALYELSIGGVIPFPLTIKKDLTTVNSNKLSTVITPNNGKGTKFDTSIRPGELNECIQAFASEQPNFNPDYMECVKDEFHTPGNKKSADYSYGSIVMQGSNLVGLKSVYGSAPNDKYFIVVKLAKHCKWLEDVSNGAVKCV